MLASDRRDESVYAGHASPQAQLRHRVLSEVRFQSKAPPFNLTLAAKRLRADRAEILGALAVLCGLGLVRLDVDAGYCLASAVAEVA